MSRNSVHLLAGFLVLVLLNTLAIQEHWYR